MVQFRPIKSSDKEEVLAIAADTWDGEDYIHLVWDEWLEDEKSEFTAIIYDEELVGFGRFVHLGPEEVWLEGARIRKDMRGKGLGGALLDYYLNLARDRGFSCVRYLTDIDNYAAINMARNRGGKIICKYHLLTKKLPSSLPEVKKEPAEIKEVTDDLINNLNSTPFVKYGNGFFSYRWQFLRLTRESLVDYLKTRHAFTIHDGYLLFNPPDMPDEPAYITLISGNSKEVKNLLLNWALKLASRYQAGKIFVKLPSYPPLLQFFQGRGFNPAGESTGPHLVLIEFNLARLQGNSSQA